MLKALFSLGAMILSWLRLSRDRVMRQAGADSQTAKDDLAALDKRRQADDEAAKIRDLDDALRDLRLRGDE
jgi:hypothetical protein